MGKKEIRQDRLIRFILQLGYIPRNPRILAKKFHVSVRTIQRDINDIHELLRKVALDEIEENVILRLHKRIPKMKDPYIIRLAELIIPKKQQLKMAEETKIIVKMWPWSQEKEKNV